MNALRIRSTRLLLAATLCSLAWLPSTHAQKTVVSPEDLPLFELAEHEVVYSETNFTPRFKYETPQFSYYEVPDLPKGELVLSLDFMDRYRENLIPGTYKWAGLLHFPVVDGYDRSHLKWICLYFYNDQMYGYDPSAKMESERRFVIPIRYADRENKGVLLQFAESYVESIFPEVEEYYYEYEQGLGGDSGGDMGGEMGDGGSGGGYEDGGFDTLEVITIPAGRIAPVLNSQKGRSPEDLVRIVYRLKEEPNPGFSIDPEMGPGENFGKRKMDFSWANVAKELGGYSTSDYIEIAQGLVSPRWSMKIVFHHKKTLLLWKLEAKASAMLFNIGNKLYAYSPKYGVWKTDGNISDLKNPKALEAKLRYPGIQNVERIEFVPNKTVEPVQGS